MNMSKKLTWLVRMHYKMRTLSFALVFIATCLQIWDQNYGAKEWAYIATLLLIYPHLQFWRSIHASDSVKAEIHNLLIDSVLLGAFIPTVQFSDWLSFSVVAGTLANNAANQGWLGVRRSFVAILIGMAIGALVMGFKFSPHTGAYATAFCIAGLGYYLLAICVIGFSRNKQLRDIRETLKSREKELLDKNELLERNLEEINELRGKLSDQANHDALTGLVNRRYLSVALEREFLRCVRDRSTLSLIMIDVDHFKKYNDRYGHLAGDQCLRKIAETLRAQIRRSNDIVARYGGEEFLLLLPETERNDAEVIAQKLIEAIRDLAIPHDQSSYGVVTISAGLVAMKDENFKSVESLAKAADDALYSAKWRGRNKLYLAAELGDLDFVKVTKHKLDSPLIWRESYKLGHDLIDEQHRALFADINALRSALNSSEKTDVVEVLLDKFMRDIAEHFSAEETIIGAKDDAAREKHAKTHLSLMERTVGIISKFKNNEVDSRSVLRFLARDVVALHMLHEDGLFRKLISPTDVA